MAGNTKSFAERAAQSRSSVFFQGRISSILAYAPVTFCKQVSRRAGCLLLPCLFFRRSSCLSRLVFAGQTSQLVKQKSAWNQEPLQQCAIADLGICKAISSHIVCRGCCLLQNQYGQCSASLWTMGLLGPVLYQCFCFRGRLPGSCVRVTQGTPSRDTSLCGFCI